MNMYDQSENKLHLRKHYVTVFYTIYKRQHFDVQVHKSNDQCGILRLFKIWQCYIVCTQSNVKIRCVEMR